MNKLLLAGAALLVSLSSTAFAADLYIPSSPLPIVEGAAYDWSGAYVGATVGGEGVRVLAPGQGDITGGAAVGGIFAGANFQASNLVYGVEADLEYSGFNATKPCGNPAWTCNAYVNGQGSIRGRFGYAVDTLLFYGTAGLAVGNAGGSTTSPGGVVFPDSSVRFGWTVGAGIEAAFNDNWFGRLEYRYTDFGTRDMNFDVAYRGVSVTTHTIRAGIGYKF